MKMKDIKKYNAIKRSVIDLIVTEGLSGASMSKIAKRANLSPSTIYVYFENREKMISDIYIASKIELSHFLLNNVDFAQDFKTVFKEVWRNLHNYILKNPNIYYFLEYFESSPHIDKIEDQKVMDVYFASLFAFIEKAKKMQVIKELPNEILRAFAMPPIAYVSKLHLKKAINLTDELFEEMLEMSWNAIKR